VKRIGLLLLTIVLLGSAFATFSPSAEAYVSGGHLTVYNAWNNGGGYIAGEAYGYESFTGHDIEVEACTVYNGTFENCAVQDAQGYSGAAPIAYTYTASGGSGCWQVWGWLYDYVTGASMTAWSSGCVTLYRHP
jgi:hypothetical protein